MSAPFLSAVATRGRDEKQKQQAAGSWQWAVKSKSYMMIIASALYCLLPAARCPLLFNWLMAHLKG
jgi:hypothetical protein